MAVVAAVEFNDLAASRGAARQANGTHARFGAGADQADHLHRGHKTQNGFGQLDFALRWSAEAKAIECSFLHRFEHARVAVPEDHGAP